MNLSHAQCKQIAHDLMRPGTVQLDRGKVEYWAQLLGRQPRSVENIYWRHWRLRVPCEVCAELRGRERSGLAALIESGLRGREP
jgi:hypothetical protein